MCEPGLPDFLYLPTIYQKTGENVPNDHKIVTIKHTTKWSYVLPMYITNGYKNTNISHFDTLQNMPKLRFLVQNTYIIWQPWREHQPLKLGAKQLLATTLDR
jgi:hypothetical protein